MEITYNPEKQNRKGNFYVNGIMLKPGKNEVPNSLQKFPDYPKLVSIGAIVEDIPEPPKEETFKAKKKAKPIESVEDFKGDAI